MKIPKQIKIGGFNYNVDRPTTHFIGDNNVVLDGQCDTTGKTIKVSAVGCEEYQEVVFLHEVCHAIINHYVSWDEQDEKFVEQFAKGLYQVLIDNKDIFESDTE